MKNSKSNDWEKFSVAFGIVTLLSGIYLIFQQDYLIGICGSITGLFLIFFQKMQEGTNRK